MLGVRTQKMAADFLCTEQAAFVEMVGDRQQLARQCGDAVSLGNGGARFAIPPSCCLQPRQLAPACLQRRIEPDGTRIGGNRFFLLIASHRQMSRLLPGAPVFGHRPVERDQMVCRLPWLACVARSDGGNVERVAIARVRHQQVFRHGETARVVPCLQRLARGL